MSNEMKINAALANLEAGKFSFQMVDAITEHVRKLETELDAARSLHADIVHELKRQQYANWRLEGELRKLNAKIYAVLKANILTEIAYREMTFVATKIGEYFDVFKKSAGATLDRSIADLQSGKLQSRVVEESGRLYSKLKANMPTDEALQATTPYIEKYQDSLKKHLGASLEKAAAYISTLKKTPA